MGSFNNMTVLSIRKKKNVESNINFYVDDGVRNYTDFFSKSIF